MAEQITLKLEPRNTLGKKVKALRRAGVTPVHLYGPGIVSKSLQCPSAELLRVMAQAGRNTPISVAVEGQEGRELALVREVRREPLKGDVLHVDFLRVEVTQPISAEVPLVLKGESPGAREARGAVVHQLYQVVVEALPLDIPHELEVDVSVLTEPDSVIRAGDIPLPPNVTLITDAEETVARIEAARVEAEEVAVEVAEEAEAPPAPEAPGAERAGEEERERG